jgi:septal ring factor EnvC (AmiA/AmiB activator)
LLAASGAPSLGAATQAEARNELRELRTRIEALQKKLLDAESSHAAAADALRASERAISDTHRRLHELALESRELNRQIGELTTRRRAAEASVREQQAIIERILSRQYVEGRHAPLKILLSGEDPNQLARTLFYMRYIARSRAEAVERLRATLAQVRVLAAEMERNGAALKSLAVEATSEKRRLEGEKDARSRVLARLAREIDQQRREIGTLKRNESRLARLIEELGRVVVRKPSAPRLSNQRVPGRAEPSGPFEALKGRLKLPVRGELANRFGSPRREGALTWKGLFITARAGDEVRAIAAGTVVFADWLRGFGNLLIIDHGGAYMSLYGYNEALLKRVGEAIRGGDPIATVGNSGGNADSGLYFELRHEGRPLDPLKWVDIQ